MKTLARSLAVSAPSTLPVTGFDRRIAALLALRFGNAAVGVALWNGEMFCANGAAVESSLRIADRATLVKLLTRPSFEFGDCYARGLVEVDGDLVATLTALFVHAWTRPSPWSGLATLRDRLTLRSKRTARSNARHHYDLGNDFYRLWLDQRMLYSCAYFPTPDTSLEDAQSAKIDLVCRKLGLRAGQSVVELGSGWGALALHMASRYGVKVRAFNVSQEQVAWSREHARRAEIDGRVEFVADDYRNARGRYDAVVSVGMLEAVGPGNYRSFGAHIARLLDPAGRALVHTIGRHRPLPTNAWIRRRIFPGGYAPSLGEMSAIFEPNDLAILDIENLRLHYALTLQHWLGRFRAERSAVARQKGEDFARTWELYLAASQASFASGWSHLYQVVCTRAANNAIAWTRVSGGV